MYDGEGNGTPLQYSCLENPMDGGAWWAAVHGVAKSWTRLSDFTFTFHFHVLEEEMATHSSVLAWRIPGTAGPGGQPSMGSHRVGHDWSDLAAAAAAVMYDCYILTFFFLCLWKVSLSSSLSYLILIESLSSLCLVFAWYVIFILLSIYLYLCILNASVIEHIQLSVAFYMI